MTLWGLISAQTMQTLMACAAVDLERHGEGTLDLDSVRSLAALGSGGAHGQNCWRDLQARLPKTLLPSPHAFQAPLRHNILGTFSKQALASQPARRPL